MRFESFPHFTPTQSGTTETFVLRDDRSLLSPVNRIFSWDGENPGLNPNLKTRELEPKFPTSKVRTLASGYSRITCFYHMHTSHTSMSTSPPPSSKFHLGFEKLKNVIKTESFVVSNKSPFPNINCLVQKCLIS